MYSILDIDLDYFNQMPDAAHRLEQLLNWAACPVSMVVERHNHAFARWRKRWQTHNIPPSHILHVDEHHDMMDQRKQANIGNFMFHAMHIWPLCRVHWLVDLKIDSPQQWLPEDKWKPLSRRFTSGNRLCSRWPTPDLVTVCTSPGFIDKALCKRLLGVVGKASPERRKTAPSRSP